MVREAAARPQGWRYVAGWRGALGHNPLPSGRRDLSEPTGGGGPVAACAAKGGGYGAPATGTPGVRGSSGAGASVGTDWTRRAAHRVVRGGEWRAVTEPRRPLPRAFASTRRAWAARLGGAASGCEVVVKSVGELTVWVALAGRSASVTATGTGPTRPRSHARSLPCLLAHGPPPPRRRWRKCANRPPHSRSGAVDGSTALVHGWAGTMRLPRGQRKRDSCNGIMGSPGLMGLGG